MNLQLMDVTLRESVHVFNTSINLEKASKVVAGLSKSKIDYVEIGYISPVKDNYLPSYCPKEYIDCLANSIDKNSNTKLVLMLHPSQYHSDLLERIQHTSVGMIRLCISMDNLKTSLPIVKELKDTGIKICANLIRASHASISDILDFENQVASVGADYIYLADSNGAMLPNTVSKLFSRLKESSSIGLGFHPHDNLNLASANALAAINEGCTLIDASIYGFGKGPGNLCLESFVAILNKLGVNKKYQINELIELSKNSYQSFILGAKEDSFFSKEEGIISGLHNLNLDILDSLEEMANDKGMKLLDLLLLLEKQTWIHRAAFELNKKEYSLLR